MINLYSNSNRNNNSNNKSNRSFTTFNNIKSSRSNTNTHLKVNKLEFSFTNSIYSKQSGANTAYNNKFIIYNNKKISKTIPYEENYKASFLKDNVDDIIDYLYSVNSKNSFNNSIIKAKIEKIISLIYTIYENYVYTKYCYIYSKKILSNRGISIDVKNRINPKPLKKACLNYIKTTFLKSCLKDKLIVKEISSENNYEYNKQEFLKSINFNIRNFSDNINYFYKHDSNILLTDLKKYIDSINLEVITLENKIRKLKNLK